MKGAHATLAPSQSWAVRTIADTGKYINGLAFKPTDWGDEGMPIIRIQNLTNPTKPLNKTTRAVDPAYVVNPGDILVSWSATLDAFIWDREPGLLNQHIFKVVPDTSVVTKKFLFYTLKKAIAEMIKSEHLHGSTMKHINRGPFLAHKIEVPTLAQQDEIVAELEKQFSRLDEAVANLQRVKANLKRYKAAVLKAAVEGRLVETEASIARREGRGYETGEQLRQRILKARRGQWSGRGKYKEPLAHDPCDLPNAPEGWAWCSVDEASAETLIGLDKGRDQQRTEAVGVPYVKMNNVTMDGDVLTDELVYVDASDEERARFHLARGDLLFNTRNSVELVGKVGIVRTVPAGAVFNNNLMRLRTPDGVSSVFLGYQMCSLGFRQRMERVKKATTSVAAVYQKDLLPLAVALPPMDEQLRIVSEVDRRLSVIREIEGEVDTNLQRAQALRQATLVKAFSGECA